MFPPIKSRQSLSQVQNNQKLRVSKPKKLWKKHVNIDVKNNFLPQEVLRLGSLQKSARPFKSSPKNLWQVNLKKKAPNFQVEVLCNNYTAKKQEGNFQILYIPWLSAMEECIIPLQWSVSAPSYDAMHPPLSWSLKFSETVSSHSRILKIGVDFFGISARLIALWRT